MANEDFSIARLFFAGVVTAAGAGFFWWITGGLRKSVNKTESDDSPDDLDRLLIVAEAEQA